MTYYNTTIFSTQRRQVWEKQFNDSLMETLFDQQNLLDAVNKEKVICINNSPVNDLTNDEFQQLIQAFDNNDYSYFSLTQNVNWGVLNDLGLESAQLDQLSEKAKILYTVALMHAMRPIMGYDDTSELTELKKIYLDYIKNHPDQEDYAKKQAMKYLSHVLGLAKPVLESHIRLAQADYLLQTGMNNYNDNPLVSQYVNQIREEVYQLVAKVKNVKEINELSDVMDVCGKALINPTKETIQACIDKGNALTEHSLTKSLGGLMLTIAGVAIFTISVAAAVESFGLAAPLSAMGIALGESLIVGSVASGSAALSVGGSAFGSYMFFKHAHTDPLSEDVYGMANTVCAA